jgi:hypothetical protein
LLISQADQLLPKTNISGDHQHAGIEQVKSARCRHRIEYVLGDDLRLLQNIWRACAVNFEHRYLTTRRYPKIKTKFAYFRGVFDLRIMSDKKFGRVTRCSR